MGTMDAHKQLTEAENGSGELKRLIEAADRQNDWMGTVDRLKQLLEIMDIQKQTTGVVYRNN